MYLNWTLILVPSFDNLFYICKTCDKKLLKKEIPCQSTKNKLELFDMRNHLQNINKIECHITTHFVFENKNNARRTVSENKRNRLQYTN